MLNSVQYVENLKNCFKPMNVNSHIPRLKQRRLKTFRVTEGSVWQIEEDDDI